MMSLVEVESFWKILNRLFPQVMAHDAVSIKRYRATVKLAEAFGLSVFEDYQNCFVTVAKI